MRHKRTGIFATKEEGEKLMQLIESATVPVEFTGEVDLGQRAHIDMRKGIHACALEHGLPEVPGYYGYDHGSREFLVMDYETGEAP